MSAGWRKYELALHALLESIRISVEQATSLRAKIVLRAVSRINLQRAVRSAQKESTRFPVIRNALSAEQEHGIMRKERQCATYANKGSTRRLSAQSTLRVAMHAQKESTRFPVIRNALSAEQEHGIM